MKGKFFLDTNIFVYSFDNRYPDKIDKAISLIKSALNGKGVISYQVIQEFTNVALSKFSTPLKHNDCKNYVEHFMIPICEVHSNTELFKTAIDLKKETNLSFYDSLIISAALYANCSILYSEDLTHGQIVRGVKIQNPFINIHTL